MDDSLRVEVAEPVLSHAEACRLVGSRRSYPFADELETTFDGLRQQIGEAMAGIDDVAGRVDDATVGAMLAMFTGGDGFEYLSGVEVLPDTPTEGLPDGWVALDVPAGRQLAFTTTLADLRGTVWTVWHEWLPGSPYRAAGGGEVPDYVERYDERFDPETGGGTVEVIFPILD
jgi:AraC family transcriptional regulator